MAAVPESGGAFSREPLGRKIADVLRDDILVGRLAPGEHLNQQQICERFGTSRMPVRDALLLLTYEGIVVDEGAGRVKVTQFSARDLQDVYLLEGILHGLACERVAATITVPQLEELEALREATQAAADAGDLAKVDAVSWALHRRINQMAGSSRLLQTMRSVASAIPRSYVETMPGWAPKMVQMQTSLIAALRAHDGQAARAVVEEHTRTTGDEFIGYLRSRGVLQD